MERALELARRGRYTSHPNPRVGCVIVRDGAIVGEGWHARAGEPHAEIHALNQAGTDARGATVYVTLEPCCHQGRTPPCTQALIQADVRRVVMAMADPNPQIEGRGARTLQEAGIEVVFGVGASAAEAVNAGFVTRMRKGRPLVRVKMAMSLDGRTAMASGESRWITHTAAREDVHRQRAEAGAVMVGIETVLADDPRLNVRLDGEWRQPDRVVLDTHARTPPAARVFGEQGRTIIVTADPESENAARLAGEGATVLGAPQQDARLDLSGSLAALAELGINSLLVEAGPSLAGSLMDARLVDELLLYVAPDLLGCDARGLMRFNAVERLADRKQLCFLDVDRIGPDLRLRLAPITSDNQVQ